MDKRDYISNVKFFLLIFIPLALFFSCITGLFLYQEVNKQTSLLQSNEMQTIEKLNRIVNENIRSVVSDLFLLSADPAMYRMIADENVATRQELARLFKKLSRRTGLYDQIRFLDASGMERVRINHNQGNPLQMPAKSLQNKGKRYYFQDTYKLEPGRIFVSPFDLNIERGKVEVPLKPMIRFGTPVIDPKGAKHGIVLLNYFGKELLADLEQAASDSAGGLMLLNAQGYWLKGLEKNDEWGFVFSRRNKLTLARRHPEAWKTIASSEAGQFHNDQGIYTFTTIRPLYRNMQSSTGNPAADQASAATLSNKEFAWKIVTLVTSQKLQKRQAAILYGWLPYLVLTVAFLALVSWAISLTSTLRKQTQAERMHRERLQGVLEMAGAVCHEINQPLMSVSGYSELLLLDTEPGSPAYVKAEKIKGQADRMGHITKKLMRITKYETKGYLDGNIVDIDKAVDGGPNRGKPASHGQFQGRPGPAKKTTFREQTG